MPSHKTAQTTKKAAESKAPATHPKKAPSGEQAVREMGAEDESSSDAHRSKDKTGSSKQTRR